MMIRDNSIGTSMAVTLRLYGPHNNALNSIIRGAIHGEQAG
jgi:hypothetical protein